MAAAMSKLKNGADSAERKALKIEVLAERLTGNVVPHFVTPAMQHGTDTEPTARAAYEMMSGQLVSECGFIRHPTISDFGASPDGRIGKALGVDPESFAARLRKLVQAGMALRLSGARWQITQAGRDALASDALISLGKRRENLPTGADESALWVLIVGARRPSKVSGRLQGKMQMGRA
jgi:hypothetical protein